MVLGIARFVTLIITTLLLGGAAAQAQQEKLRFIVVTHGAASSPFWGAIRDGATLAATEADVEVVYRAPDTFDLDRMASLLTTAVEEEPDGIVVSIPNADALAAPIRSAVDAGIPVISINSGFDVGRSLGALLHVGQGEYEAGRVAGEAMRRFAGTNALCLNHELGNVALDLRCKGFIDGFAGSVEVMPVPGEAEKAREAIAARLADDARVDVLLALSAASSGEAAVAAAKQLEGRMVHVGTFDVTAAILEEVADGAASFAIDQQPFLQGYLPVHFLAVLHRHGAVPVSDVSTGPRLVTKEEAKRRLGREDEDEGNDAGAAPQDPAAGSDG